MKNVQSYKGSSMSWKIVSKITDTYDFLDGSHNEYIVYVQDATGRNIVAKEAFGLADRTKVTKELLEEYQEYGIAKIEHED
jgi:hypothetical protein|tara:strand:+ start:57 stop:299 length:243 start_codon:yes stop_codon:yes gene_type:complete